MHSRFISSSFLWGECFMNVLNSVFLPWFTSFHITNTVNDYKILHIMHYGTLACLGVSPTTTSKQDSIVFTQTRRMRISFFNSWVVVSTWRILKKIQIYITSYFKARTISHSLLQVMIHHVCSSLAINKTRTHTLQIMLCVQTNNEDANELHRKFYLMQVNYISSEKCTSERF